MQVLYPTMTIVVAKSATKLSILGQNRHMANSDMVRAYVEKILKEFLGTDALKADDDGDFPIRHGSAAYYVRITGGDSLHVSVFSEVLLEVEASAELYEVLNDINAHIRGARIFHRGDRIILATEVEPDDMQPAELAAACERIAKIADHYDDQLHDKFGGKLMFDEDATESVEV